MVADRIRIEGEQHNVYRGVVLNVKARKYVDSISNFERDEIFA